VIKPTVGRVVWFYKYLAGQGHKGPLAAHVCCVHSDSRVNLMVIDENGNPHSETSVLLIQEDASISPDSNYCTWMPYQKGQAAKTEAAEEKLAERKANEGGVAVDRAS
jgi:hypothetical protein